MTIHEQSLSRWRLALSFAFLVGVAYCALAQLQPIARAEQAAQPDARTVAAQVQAFYDQTRDLTASFFQTYVNKLYNRTDKSKGRVVFKKPGKMRWDYDKPNGKIIVSNGSRLVVYEPGEPGEHGQVIEQSISDSQLPQAMAFLMGTGRLEDDFNFRLLDAAKHGYSTGAVLELRPKKPTPHYERILFYVEQGASLRGLVRRLLIIDETGNRNRFDFQKIKFNDKVADGVFNWHAPAGTRRANL